MTDDPRKKKPAAPARPPPAPARPAPAREQFIGHESMTMMGDETFADFQKRMKEAEGEAEESTAAVPAHVPGKKAPPPPPARPAPRAAPVAPQADDSLPDEYDGSAPAADPVKETEALYGVKLPVEYARFLKERQFEQYDNQFCPLVQDGRDTFHVRFLVGASIFGVPDFGVGEDFSFGNIDDLRDEQPSVIPFAAWDATGEGEIDSGALVLDVKKAAGGKCPVFQADDGQLTKVAGSIAEFLASLTPDAPEGSDDSDSDSDDDDSGDDDDSRRGQHGRPGFRPKDRDGVEWDYVTHEGVGFNDDDDEDAMTFEKNGKTYFKPDWGGWKHDDYVGYWMKHFDLEQSQEGGEANFQATLKKYGLRNRNHWKRATQTFMQHHAKDPEFTNAALIARQEGSRAKMRDALKPGMLDPVEGVSLQVWASINAKLVSGGDLKKLLAPHKIDEAKWGRASDTWNARMSDQSNPDAAMAIATEYGKAFAGGGVGAYGASAQEASASMGVNDKVAGKKVKGAEPVSFERWVEIQSAQGAWATQGKDVNAMLKKVFGLTAVDWSNMSAHWSQKLSTDYQLAGKYGELNAKYTAKYSAGESDPDGDLEV